ncbi:MAG: hypothetical protein QM642_04020 [Edaphocola sp.]
MKQETNRLYLEGVEGIARRGIKLQSIICDGRKGLFELFGNDIPIQMCNFHQVATIGRHLTKKPKMQAGKESWELVPLLVHTDKESLTGGSQHWFGRWESFLNEKKVDENGKKRYVHKRPRSAYGSLKNNLPYLFAWYDNMALDIPSTTNAIDGIFADLKDRLRNHNGLSIARKQKFIDGFLKVY